MFKNFGSLAATERAGRFVNEGKLKMLEESGRWPYAVARDAFYRLVPSFLEGARQ